MSTRTLPLIGGAPGALYIDLMKRCLTNSIYQDSEFALVSTRGPLRRLMRRVFDRYGLKLVRPVRADRRENGRDWPQSAHTMMGVKRMNNLHHCVEQALVENVPGDFIETGVWRGGGCILMRAILKAHGVLDRKVWVADSFAGLPPGTHPKDRGGITGELDQELDLAVSIEQVKANFAAYGLLDDQVHFLQGWFRDTLPTVDPATRFAVVRLDGDLYESTMDGLENLYRKLSVGGYLIVDDYGVIPECKAAVTEYRERNGITEEIQDIDGWAVYWRKRGAN